MRKGKKNNMAKKKTVEKTINIDNILFNCKETQKKLAEKFVNNVGLQQAQLFAGHDCIKVEE